MAGIIVADTIQSGGDFIRLNSASQTVATINVRGIYANTGNLLIAANGTIGVASITNTAITGTMTQAQIGNGVAGTGPVFRAILSGNQTISSNVATKVSFSNETYDTNGNASSGTFTPTVAGYYMIGTTVAWSGDITAPWFIALYKNGSVFSYLQQWVGSTLCHGLSGSDIVYCNGTTDYIEIYVYHQQTGNKSLTSAAETFVFSSLIRAA